MLYILVPLAIFLVFFAIFWILLKKPFKAFFLSSLISLVIVIICGFIIYKDVVEFANKFPNEPKLFLFEENNEIVGGAVLAEIEIEVEEGETEPDMNFVTESQLTELNNAYRNENFESMLGNNYMLFIFKSEVFTGIEVETPPLPPGATHGNKLKYNTMINFMKFGKLTEEQGPLVILKGYKNRDIIIYPETVSFKFIKQVPQSLFEKISEMMGMD